MDNFRPIAHLLQGYIFAGRIAHHLGKADDCGQRVFDFMGKF